MQRNESPSPVSTGATPRPRHEPADTDSLRSLHTGLALLATLTELRRPAKLSDLAARSGMAPAKAHRYLASLVRSGHAIQEPDSGLYATGPRTLDLGLACLSALEPVAAATRAAQALCRETDQTVAVSVWGSYGPTVVGWDQPPRPVMVNVGLGSVFPLLESATGRVFAAFHDAEAVRAALRTAPRDARESLDDVRRRGMARARNDFMAGLSAFAAPVFDRRGAMVLAVTVLGYSARWDARWRGPLAEALRRCTTELSTALGHRRRG